MTRGAHGDTTAFRAGAISAEQPPGGRPGDLELGVAQQPVTDPGAEELLAGYARALTVRATIRLAIEILSGQPTGTRMDAYTVLCARAAEHEMSLGDTAADIVKQHL